MRSVTRPCREFTSAEKDFTLSSFATSTTWVVTSTLLLGRDCAVCCNPASSTSAMASAEPAAANRCASARPMPEPAPVTTATPSLKKDMKKTSYVEVFISRRKRICHAIAMDFSGRPIAIKWSSNEISWNGKGISILLALNQQRAFGLERAELRGVVEPSARVNLRRWRRIRNTFVPHVSETRSTEKLAPFLGGEQMCIYREQIAPLMTMRIVAVVVDENPRRAAGLHHAKNVANAGGRIRPVIRRLDGNRVREEIRLPGNFLHFAGNKHQVFELHAGAPRVANHLVGNIHADHAALRHEFAQPPREPAGPTSNVENAVAWSEPHFLQNRQRNGQVVLLHA